MNTNLKKQETYEMKKKTSVSKKKILMSLKKNYQLYILLLPALIYFIVFRYVPMYGVQIAFKDYYPAKGFLGSPWVGFEHFERFFRSSEIWLLLKNTITLSLYNLLVGFPFPIIIALLLNYVGSKRYRGFIQNTLYAPHFISTVVLVGMLQIFLSPRSGIINIMLGKFGIEPIFFMAKPSMFKSLYVWSDVWQNMGWNSIIYIAALTSVSPELHESAIVDGASKLQRLWYIDLPSILPTAITMLILNSGRVLTVGFEKVYLMQNNLNRTASEVISTYVYKIGINNADYSYATAIGLFESLISFIILIIVNKIAQKVSETSLW